MEKKQKTIKPPREDKPRRGQPAKDRAETGPSSVNQPLRKSIKDWAKDDRPREKLQFRGPDALSNSELLAILIAKGTRGESAIELAKQILDDAGNDLNRLGQYSVEGLQKVKGIGPAKAISIAAALELGRRRQAGALPENPVASGSKVVANYLRPLIIDYKKEVFGALYLNQSGKIIQTEIIHQGGITCTTVDPRLIFAKALEIKAVSIIVYHNHPSGNPKPSKADLQLTESLQQGARYLNIRLLDHLIIGNETHFSFADANLLHAWPNPTHPTQSSP